MNIHIPALVIKIAKWLGIGLGSIFVILGIIFVVCLFKYDQLSR